MPEVSQPNLDVWVSSSNSRINHWDVFDLSLDDTVRYLRESNGIFSWNLRGFKILSWRLSRHQLVKVTRVLLLTSLEDVIVVKDIYKRLKLWDWCLIMMQSLASDCVEQLFVKAIYLRASSKELPKLIKENIRWHIWWITRVCSNQILHESLEILFNGLCLLLENFERLHKNKQVTSLKVLDFLKFSF
jgi:hypothetical protein